MIVTFTISLIPIILFFSFNSKKEIKYPKTENSIKKDGIKKEKQKKKETQNINKFNIEKKNNNNFKESNVDNNLNITIISFEMKLSNINKDVRILNNKLLKK